MDQQIIAPSGESAWILEAQPWQTTEGTGVILIRKPTAFNLLHRLLNPHIYRNIKDVGTLDELAALLDTPDNWEERYNQVVGDGYMIRTLNRFHDLANDTAESDIQSQFILLVSNLPIVLVLIWCLALKLGSFGRHLIASEAKTNRAFALGEMWYHGSRGIQVLSALYAYNSPTFLFTQKQWKLFVENSDRNAVLTFPYDDNPDHTPHVNSSLVQPMGTTFLKAIVICLLSRRVSLEESMKSTTLQESSEKKETPKKTIIKPKYFDTPEKAKTQSARLQGQPKPSYVSGFDDAGLPIYSLIRVVPAELAARIEDEIALQEKKGHYEKQTSEMTLVE
ncbi:hypothetical protein BDR26DRAFT_981135 [Obelidium mucronatum]|nr:hypothetical protein BDR26DRAFT_981135 [Obelidium mucronatum]